nr:MAG TPA: hypothetical protein [Caudoviricetes sp.]
MKQFLKDFCLVAAIVLMITALGGAIDGCPAGWVAALLVFAGLGGIVWLIWRTEVTEDGREWSNQRAMPPGKPCESGHADEERKDTRSA